MPAAWPLASGSVWLPHVAFSSQAAGLLRSAFHHYLQNLRTVRTPAQRDYTQLLTLLDEVASREVTTVLDELQVLTEPHVARTLAAMLPSGRPGLRCAALWL